MKKLKKDRSPLIYKARENSEEIEKLPENYSSFFPPAPEANIDEWIISRSGKDIITVDVRSEDEYSEDRLPGSVNFPILDNNERDEVGFLYKQVSPKAALFHALNIAENKTGSIREFCNGIKGKKAFIYCWRGGGRSTAACHYFKDNGIDCIKIQGGYKSYRNKIYETFYKDPSEFDFVVLTGLTGCGKTEIIEHLSRKVPVLDIEKSAGHASSIFGKVRFELKNAFIPDSQKQFENSMFCQLIDNPFPSLPYITEGESKRISNFNIPEKLYRKLISSPAVLITSDISRRVQRIKNDYFSSGIEKIYKIVENSGFFKRLLGYEKVDELLKLLKNDRIDEFCEWFLLEYYDKRYASNYKNLIAEVKNTDVEKASEVILELIRKRRS